MQHGRGRGRLHGFRQHVLDWIGRHRPALAARIRLHETGSPPPSLDGLGGAVFWLADPLRELYPDDYAEAVVLAEAVRAGGGQVLNPPEALSNPIKSAQARRWQEAGIPCAPAAPVAGHDRLAAAVERVGLPAIVRADLHHAQEETWLCRTAADVAALPASGRIYPAVALGFVDVRAAWRRERPDDLRARWHHKKRAFVFGDRVVPNHCLFAETPVVGLQSSCWWKYRGRWAALGWTHRLRPGERAALAADLAFAHGPGEHAELLARAVRALGLDLAAVDYSDLPHGSAVLWEANPYFTLPVGRKGPLAGPRRLARRVDRILSGMADQMDALGRPAPAQR